MARRLEDPDLLVQALADRHLSPQTPADFAARERAAEEIIELGERLGRPEVALLGYEWRFGERIGQADMPAAEAALARLELYTHLTPSPHWRFASALRRACMDSLQGDRDSALRGLDDAVRSAEGWLHPGEIRGIQMGFHAFTAYLYDQADPALVSLYEQNVEIVGDLPAPFLHAGLAFAAWMLGEPERAKAHLSRTAPGIDAIAVGLESLFALQVCGLTAAEIGDVRMARTIRPLLEPFADRLTSSGSIAVPIATTLALLCDLTGDSVAAAAHHRAGVAVAERTGSAVIVARCRELAGTPVPMPPPAGGMPVGRATITPHGREWVLASPLGAAVVEESRGLLQLIDVLRANGREVGALDLAGSGSGPAVAVQSDLGPALDGRAKREYRSPDRRSPGGDRRRRGDERSRPGHPGAVGARHPARGAQPRGRARPGATGRRARPTSGPGSTSPAASSARSPRSARRRRSSEPTSRRRSGPAGSAATSRIRRSR